MSNTIIITGRTGKAAELKFTPSGTAVLNGSVADTPRRFNKDRNEWEDSGDTLWLDWALFGADAEHLADQIEKGAKVTVVGKLKSRTFQTRDGDKRTVNEITADSVAVHAPSKGAGWNRDEKPARGGDDPWATKPTDSAPPF